MANQYNDDSIDMLLGAERIRRRPASMLGDNGLFGARHGFTEIYGNALDEASSGFGSQLDVTYYKNGAMSIRDYGRGVPLGWNEKKNNYNWHIIYNELYGGGKYDNGQWYLRSLDNWSDWDETNDREIFAMVQNNLGIDLREIPADGVERAYGDITIKHVGTTFYMRVNNASWGMVTWEFLNERLNYLASVGLNGLGAASTQYTSEFFTVKSYRDGVCTEMNFKKGYPIINGEPLNVFAKNYDMSEFPPKTYETDEPNGTFIYWKPDAEVFTNTNIGSDWLFETCRDIAHVAGIKLNFTDEVTGNSETIEAGSLDTLIADKYSSVLKLNDDEESTIFKASKFNHGNTRVEGKPFVWVCKVDVAIGLVNKKVDNSCYHNSVKMKQGAQYDGIYYALRDFFSDVSKTRGVKITDDDYEHFFGVCVSSYSNYASFRGQTKDAVQDVFICTLVQEAIYEKLTMEYGKGNKALSEIVDSVVEKANERIALRELAKITKEANKVTRLKEPAKFVTCRAYEKKQYDITELWITEGDSAAGSVKSARDKEFQSIFPIRGKGLNVLKASIDKILNNAEIKNLFALLGTGYDLNLKDNNPFDISKLKFNKIIFATDADEDGYQIRVLLYLIFYKLAPQLLMNGHVYVAETPRFEVVLSDGTKLYALNDRDRDVLLTENAGRVRKVNRFKGLGEVDADVLRYTTVAPETRNLIRLSCDFTNETERQFIDALFGADKYKQRKAILTSVLGGNVADMLDENALLLEEIENSDIEEDTEYEVV